MKQKVLDYANKYKWSTSVRETQALWTQCVALAKHFTKEVIGVSLWAFWGSAKSGWANTKKTFSSDWEKIVYKNNIPQTWDIIFWIWGKYEKYWHVGIVLDANKDKIVVLNQNTGNGDGKWTDDAVKIEAYTYENVAGWYRHKIFETKGKYETIVWELVIEDIKTVAELLNCTEEKAREIIALMQIVARRTK